MPFPSLTRYLLALASIVLVAGCFARPADAGLIVHRPLYLGLERGLVGYWSFNGSTVVGTRAYDESGQGNDGTLTGANGVPVRTAGKLGQAVDLME
jgi:hypothetical protein